MIEAVIKSSVILIITLSVLPLLRRQSAAVRHAVLTISLLCAIGVPIIGPLLPSPVRISHGLNGFSGFQSVESVQSVAITALVPLPPQRNIAFGLWVSGTMVAGILILVGAGRIAWLAFRAKPVIDKRWAAAAGEVSRTLSLKRRVRLLQNNRTSVLGTFGVLRPRLLLPREAEAWPDDRLRVILIHELAHIKRFDWLVQMLAELARAVYWFNPLFWVLCRRLRIESERACDDVVLNLGIDAKDYAAHLLELVRSLKTSGRTWTPVLAMAQPPDLERRFVAMLNPSLNHRAVTRAAVLAACVIAIGVALPLAAMRAPEPAAQNLTAPKILVAASAPALKATSSSASGVAARKSAPPKPAAAQGLGSLTGTVSDGSGAVVPGVTMTVSSVETRVVESTLTGEVGKFAFFTLPAGQYLLTAELPGFTTFRRGLEIQPSQTLDQKVTLSVGNIVQKVEIVTTGQPRPPLPPPTRIRVGGNVRIATLYSQVKPIYPQSARDAGIEGTVHLQGIIGPDGTLVTLRVAGSGDPDLTNAALEAVRQWRYSPALLNNEPVEVLTDIDVEFKLSQ